ncbi:hypothetical protein BT63DRAFT_106345 [Microthyrium microscopicum]|uniref:1,3-beta-glucanosyltransferase n=1 Tax=Microthyrium microscopicum TaxID=703497 RepID=A0A6A6TW57_9PEZI|nr:hypothetical protein BT63DRAFT_106345 [Microthyrium microscopicum]
MRAASLFATVGLLASTVLADLDPIVIKGSKFFYKTNGTEFFVQGIAYQQEAGGNGTTGASASGATTYVDPLADAARCQVDIPLMKKANTNVIRVYAVDPTKDHTTCMQLLQANGIYVFADLGNPGVSINRDTPAWNGPLLQRYEQVIDMFSTYTNVIGFFAGNEVTNSLNTTSASAFVRAAVRDSKAYIKSKNYRQMYVGYATSDDANVRENMANYFNCGDQSSAIDFWGYNIYSWCGDSSFTQSGYDQRVKEFSTYSVPSFFAEYGCNTVQPRKFTEVGTIFSSNMTGTFSGGIVYMYFQEANNYGLVDVSSGTASQLPDYGYLSSQMGKIAPTGVNSASYTATNSPTSCPAVATATWAAKASPLPPTPNTDLCSCMYNSLSCAVKSSVTTDNYDSLFGTVCGYGGGSVCAGIKTNPSTGTYGAYSMCNSTEMLSFAMDQYYKSQQNSASACSFNGAAAVKASVAAGSSCASLMSQAGPSGTGVVSSNPIGAAVGSGAAASGTGSAKGAATSITTPDHFIIGMLAYITVAGVAGASFILL